MKKYKKIGIRFGLLVIGIFIMTFAMALMTKSDLGISPVQSVAYVCSKKTGISFGTLIIVWNVLQIILQIILQKSIKVFHLLQIPFSLLFGILVDFSKLLIDNVVIERFAARLLFMAIGTFLLAVGIAFTVKANLIMNPGEATVKAIAERLKKPFGKVKIIFDAIIVAAAIILTLVFFKGFAGDTVGIGTLFSVLCTGVVVKYSLQLLEKAEKKMRTLCVRKSK